MLTLFALDFLLIWYNVRKGQSKRPEKQVPGLLEQMLPRTFDERSSPKSLWLLGSLPVAWDIAWRYHGRD